MPFTEGIYKSKNTTIIPHSAISSLNTLLPLKYMVLKGDIKHKHVAFTNQHPLISI